MNIIKMLDEESDKMLAKVGIKNADIQNLIKLGGLVIVGYLVYKNWRSKNGQQKSKDVGTVRTDRVSSVAPDFDMEELKDRETDI